MFNSPFIHDYYILILSGKTTTIDLLWGLHHDLGLPQIGIPHLSICIIHFSKIFHEIIQRAWGSHIGKRTFFSSEVCSSNTADSCNSCCICLGCFWWWKPISLEKKRMQKQVDFLRFNGIYNGISCKNEKKHWWFCLLNFCNKNVEENHGENMMFLLDGKPPA